MLSVENNPGRNEIAINGDTVQLPLDAISLTATNQEAIAALRGWSKNQESVFEKHGITKPSGSFDLPHAERNVVCLEPGGNLRWIIPKAPDKFDGDKYYYSVYRSDGDIYARNKNGYSYRLDTQTGDILETIPANHLRLGGKEIEFEGGHVDKLLRHKDIVIVKLDTSQYENPTSRNIFAYTQDGERLWQVGENSDKEAFPAFTNVYEEDGELWGVNMNGYDYQLDWQTGTPLEEKYTG